MVRVHFVDHGRFLGSRLKGAELRAVVEQAAASQERVVLDFEGVESITDSFAHELFGVLSAQCGGLLPDTLEIREANDGVRETIDYSLETAAAA
jgi:hypothetical protein